MRKTIIAAIAAGVVSVATAGSASALTLGFYNITGNNVGNAAIGEAQLSVTIADGGGGLVDFIFNNSGPEASSITDVYFDDGSLLAIATITNSAGVAFSPLANPGNLPGANGASPPFVTSTGFSADSDPPAQPNGVNPGEMLTITYSLQGTQTLADVLAELGDGRLRIGIHVQGFADGGSESFVNNGPPMIPLPTTAMLGLAGLAPLGLRRRR